MRDRPEDVSPDPAVHAVSYRLDAGPWGETWRPECACGWRGSWHERRSGAEHDGAVHQAQPDTGVGR